MQGFVNVTVRLEVVIECVERNKEIKFESTLLPTFDFNSIVSILRL